MKRYAIVRVDGTCPIYTERLSSQEIDGMFNCSYDNCKDCRYGDTKEQLIKKIVQVLRQPNGLIKGKDKQHTYRAEYLAEQILEFLGVE